MTEATRPTRADEPTSHAPVRARVLVDPGLGAMWGFAAGAALGAAPNAFHAALTVAKGLMARGMYHGTETATGAEALARVLPLAMFHAGADEQRIETALRQAEDLETRLACAAWAGAVAAATWRGDSPTDQIIAAVTDLDVASEALRDGLGEDAVIAANTTLRVDIGRALNAERVPSDGSARAALVQAFWHLVHETPPEDAMAGVSGAEAAVLGALIGARQGREALPASWLAAAGTLPVAELADFVQTGPFLGWGTPKT